MKTGLLVFLFLCCVFQAICQNPYTNSQYAIESFKDIVYGTAVDYAGNTDTLKLDIYKPVGDANCMRPVIVLVHGGAWVGGSKEDSDLVYMSDELAKKGWVVANINYRLGTHKAANYAMYLFCNNSISQPCGYISDSAEIYRANFRAMQDAKGAIRFMKSRNKTDSTDINNVFIAGESAGGFVAFAAAFTDQPGEKSISCYAIANAPNPDPDLATYGCVPSPINFSRPDLGSIDGSLHLEAYDAGVKGIGNFFGGVLDLNIFQQTAANPCVYMFHQGSDVIVNYNYGNLLGRISWECYAQSNLCQSYYYYPKAYGSEGIRQYFVSLGASAPVYQADIVANYSYLNNCLSNGHAADNLQLRLQNMVNLFASKIALSGNNPQTNCLMNSVGGYKIHSDITISPNPAISQVNIRINAALVGIKFTVTNQLGQKVMTGKLNSENSMIDISQLRKGIYFLLLENKAIKSIKLIKN
jgi:alpha/beta superfamily hydrolase